MKRNIFCTILISFFIFQSTFAETKDYPFLVLSKKKTASSSIFYEILWNIPQRNINEEYILQRKENDFPYETIGYMNSKTFKDIQLQEDETYSYRMLIRDKITKKEYYSNEETVIYKAKEYLPSKVVEVYPKEFGEGDTVTVYFKGEDAKFKREREKSLWQNPALDPGNKIFFHFGFNNWSPSYTQMADYEMQYDKYSGYYSIKLIIPPGAWNLNVVFKDSINDATSDYDFLIMDRDLYDKYSGMPKVTSSVEEIKRNTTVTIYFPERVTGKMLKERHQYAEKNNLLLPSNPAKIFVHIGYNNWTTVIEGYQEMEYSKLKSSFGIDVTIPNHATELNLNFKDEFNNYSEDFKLQVFKN